MNGMYIRRIEKRKGREEKKSKKDKEERKRNVGGAEHKA